MVGSEKTKVTWKKRTRIPFVVCNKEQIQHAAVRMGETTTIIRKGKQDPAEVAIPKFIW